MKVKVPDLERQLAVQSVLPKSRRPLGKTQEHRPATKPTPLAAEHSPLGDERPSVSGPSLGSDKQAADGKLYDFELGKEAIDLTQSQTE